MGELELVLDLTERALLRRGGDPRSDAFSYRVNISKRDLCLPSDTKLSDILGIRLEEILCRYGRPFCRVCREGLVPLAAVLGRDRQKRIDRVAAYVPWRVLHDDLALEVVGEIYAAERVVHGGEVQRLSALPGNIVMRDLSKGGVVLDTFEWSGGDLSWLAQLGERVGFPLGLALLRGRCVEELFEVKGAACCPCCHDTFPVDCASLAGDGTESSFSSVAKGAIFGDDIEYLSDSLHARRLVQLSNVGTIVEGIIYGVVPFGEAALLSDACGDEVAIADVLRLFKDQSWTNFVDYQVLHWCDYLGISKLPISVRWGDLSLAERYLVRCVHFCSICPASCRVVIDEYGALKSRERQKLREVLADILDVDSKVLLLEDSDILCHSGGENLFAIVEPGEFDEVIVEPTIGSVGALCGWGALLASPYQQCAEARRRQLASGDFFLDGELGFAAAQVRLGGYTLQELVDLPLAGVLEWEFLDFQIVNVIQALVRCGMGTLKVSEVPDFGVRRALECFKVLASVTSDEVVLSGVFAGVMPGEAEPIEHVLNHFCCLGKLVRVVSDQEWVLSKYST